jgi:hypothetical protein
MRAEKEGSWDGCRPCHDGSGGPGPGSRVLSSADLRLVGDAGARLNEPVGCAALPGLFVDVMTGLVDAELFALNDVNVTTGAVSVWEQPRGRVVPDIDDLLSRLGHQHPVMCFSMANGGCQATTFSDFVTLRELRRLELFQEVFVTADIERQVALGFSTRGSGHVGLTWNRSGLDYTERERAVLDAVRPLFVLAWEFGRLRDTVAAMQGAADAVGVATVVVGEEGVLHASPAERLLATWFGASGGPALPAPLAGWAAASRKSGRPDERVFRRDGATLTLTLAPRRPRSWRPSCWLSMHRRWLALVWQRRV